MSFNGLLRLASRSFSAIKIQKNLTRKAQIPNAVIQVADFEVTKLNREIDPPALDTFALFCISFHILHTLGHVKVH
ncbi:hypothetical protein WICANDRAFT_94977, partial [Wickerhamomyces anomalus NRRL Y-366-8]